MILYVCVFDMTSRCGSLKILVGYWGLKKVWPPQLDMIFSESEGETLSI